MPVNTPLVRRRVIEDVQLFETRIRQVEDWDFWIRCAAHGKKFQYCDWEGARALIRSHPSSMSKNWPDFLEQVLLLREKISQQPYSPEILRRNRSLKVWTIRTMGYCGIEQVATGNTVAGVWRLAKTAFRSRRFRESGKWLACAALAPFASREHVRQLPTLPITTSIWRILSKGDRMILSTKPTTSKPSKKIGGSLKDSAWHMHPFTILGIRSESGRAGLVRRMMRKLKRMIEA